MVSQHRVYDLQDRPLISLQNSYDLDAAQHFLADHAAEVIVAFDHHAVNPEVFIYVVTSGGTLSAGDYYRGSLTKWVRRMPQLHNLIRIRKSTIQALCTWDLQGRRPKDLVVLNTARNLTGLTRQEALEMVNTDKGSRG